jgi:hypothetical protein
MTDMNTSVKSIYVIRTHFINKYMLDFYRKIQNDVGAENTYMIVDNTGIEPTVIPRDAKHWTDSSITSGCIILFNQYDAKRMCPYLGTSNTNSMFHCGEPVISAAYTCIKAEYDYMWLLEYDIFYKGNLRHMLQFCDAYAVDYITTNEHGEDIRTYTKDPYWAWWGDLFGEIANVPVDKRLGCFFPINRFSKKMLKVIYDNLNKSTGYCEIYFATLCVMYGLSIGTLPQTLFGEHYAYKPVLSYTTLMQTATPGKFYHPVKGYEEPQQ